LAPTPAKLARVGSSSGGSKAGGLVDPAVTTLRPTWHEKLFRVVRKQ
jgi:hypothetical protein